MKKASELNVKEIEKKINYTFKDKSLLIQAFTRTSFCNEINPSVKVKYHSNEVLEFFGDGVLSLSIISFLLKECTERYEHGIKTELGEGDFSNIKSKLSDKQNLSKSMKALGLEKYLLMGEGDAKLGIQNEPSVMEDLYESIIGAIYIDSGMNLGTVISVVERTLDVSSYVSSKEAPKKNAKNLLQEWCDDKKHRLPHPEYKVLSAIGPDNKKTYECGVYIGEKLYGKGVGKNQKLAEAEAAKIALELLQAETKQTKADPAAVAQKLRELGSKNKVPSAEYHDLGETENSTINVKEYAVECRFMGKVAIGTGLSKQDARAAAGLAILKEIEKEEAAKKPQAKPAKKQSTKVTKPDAKATKPETKVTKPVKKAAALKSEINPKKTSQPKSKKKIFSKTG
jgi:ribonuclease-3